MAHFTGPFIIDLQGNEVTLEEKELLEHPLVGGVILFTRNYESPDQLKQLCQTIKADIQKPLLITVDQEGGRVQRFRDGFTRLPSMGQIGSYYDQDKNLGLQLAESCAWVMATELASVGVDLSFSPVLDLHKGVNPAIGDRAFHVNPQVVVELAGAFIKGMHAAGMSATGKHFPGHGSVVADSHLETPIDNRDFVEIEVEDLVPFTKLIAAGLDAVMTAHILFKQLDDQPACFSRYWLQEILRKQCQFKGIIFSDDLNMKGADVCGDYAQRSKAAFEAGCDMILLCNNRAGVVEVLDRVPYKPYLLSKEKGSLLRRANPVALPLERNSMWQQKHAQLLNYFHHKIHV